MLRAIRPYMTAGVALVGASVIAVSPISPAAPALASAARVETAAVQLAAIPSPLEIYSGLIEKAMKNSVTLTELFISNPFPIVNAIARNEIDALADAAEAFAAGDGAATLAAVADAVLVPFRAAVDAGTFVFQTLLQPETLLGLSFVALGPVINAFLAAGEAIGDIIDAVTTADFVGLVNAVINVPGRILDGVINGGYVLGGFFIFPGILSTVNFVDSIPAGPVAAIFDLAQTIGRAIRPEDDQLARVGETSAQGLLGIERVSGGDADTAPDVTTDVGAKSISPETGVEPPADLPPLDVITVGGIDGDQQVGDGHTAAEEEGGGEGGGDDSAISDEIDVEADTEAEAETQPETEPQTETQPETDTDADTSPDAADAA